MNLFNNRRIRPYSNVSEPITVGALGADDKISLDDMFRAATENCIYKINGQCWGQCKARSWCSFSHLPSVNNIGE